MSLLTAKGTFVCSTTGAGVTVSGLSFRPKAVIIWVTEQTATGFAAKRAQSFGFFTDTQLGCIGEDSADNVAATGSIGNSITDSNLIKLITTSGGSVSTEVLAQLTSMNSDGFTLNFSNFTSAYIGHYFAIGGTDVTNAYVGAANAPTTAGTLAVTAPGFKPDFLLCVTNAFGTIPRDDVGIKFSLGAASSVADQAFSFVQEPDALPTNLSSLQKTGEVIHTLNAAQTDNTVGALQSFDTNGFTINFTTVQGTARGFLYLALKGGSYKVTTDTQKTSTGTKAKTGIGFQPKGLFLFGSNRAASTSVDATLASMSIGASDGTNEGATWLGSADNVSTTDENSATVNDKVLRHATGPSTTNAEADLSSFDIDGYTLNWSTADATAREFIAVAFGSTKSWNKVQSAHGVTGTVSYPSNVTAGNLLIAEVGSDAVGMTITDNTELTVAATKLGTSLHDDTDASSYTYPSATYTNNRLYVCFVTSAIATGTAPIVSGISGGGITWVEIGTAGGVVYSGTGNAVRRTQAFRGMVTSGATTGALTITMADAGSGATSTGCHACVVELTGINTDGANGAGAIVQSNTNSGLGATSGSVTLSAIERQGNRTLAFFSHRAAEASTVDSTPAAYTSLDDGTGAAPSQGSMTEFLSGVTDTTPSASWTTSSDWSGFAVEIRVFGHNLWRKIREQADGAADQKTALWYAIAQVSEALGVAPNYVGNFKSCIIQEWAHTGGGTISLDQQNGDAQVTVTNPATPAITPTANDALVLALEGSTVGQLNTGTDVDSPYTLEDKMGYDNGATTEIGIASYQQATAASTSATFHYSASGAVSTIIASFIVSGGGPAPITNEPKYRHNVTPMGWR